MSPVEFDEAMATRIEALYPIGGRGAPAPDCPHGARRRPGGAHSRRWLRSRLLLRRAGRGGGPVWIGFTATEPAVDRRGPAIDR